MTQAPPVSSAEELYAHAIALEREAAERYTEFAGRMTELGRHDIAAIFVTLAGYETDHLDTLERRTTGVTLPALGPAEYKWLDAGAPETAARDFVDRLMTPQQALRIALDAEKRARDFFEHVRRTAADPALRALAQEMAAEEAGHVAIVEREIARTPQPR